MFPGIGKSFHYVWTGGRFPAIYEVTLAMLRNVEPHAEIFVHLVDEASIGSCAERLQTRLGVNVVEVDSRKMLAELEETFPGLARTYSELSPTAHSARSNIIRYCVLWIHGGIYLDFDTFPLRSFDEVCACEAFVGMEHVWVGDEMRVRGDRRYLLRPSTWHWALSWLARRADSLLLSGRLGLSTILGRSDDSWQSLQANNAVMGATRGSEFVAELLKALPDCSRGVRCATGPLLVDRIARENADRVRVLDREVLYSIAPGESFRLFEDVTLDAHPRALLFHYVASNHPALSELTIQELVSAGRNGTIAQRLLRSAIADIAEVPDLNCRVSA